MAWQLSLSTPDSTCHILCSCFVNRGSLLAGSGRTMLEHNAMPFCSFHQFNNAMTGVRGAGGGERGDAAGPIGAGGAAGRPGRAGALSRAAAAPGPQSRAARRHLQLARHPQCVPLCVSTVVCKKTYGCTCRVLSCTMRVLSTSAGVTALILHSRRGCKGMSTLMLAGARL